MYNLLIVDDEIHVVEGLLFDLNKDKLNISEVFTAYTIKMAKEVYDHHPIDIMLCDIEMPQGSGLELLAWVGEHYAATETIIITSHADFAYAKEAIELGSLDYLLKPVPTVDLEKAIEKAINKLSQKSQFNHYHKFWSQHHPLIIEKFWLDLLQQTIPSNEKAISEVMKERNLPYSKQMKFILLLLSVQRWNKDMTIRDQKILEYALKNGATEMIIDESQTGSFVQLDQNRMLIIMAVEPEIAGMPGDLRSRCNAYIESCHRFFYCDISCYIGMPVHAHEIPRMFDQLKALERNNVAYNNKVFLLKGDTIQPASVKLPDTELWAALLKKGAKEAIISEIASYLEGLVSSNQIHAEILQKLHIDLMQRIYYVLNLKGIQAHELFSDPVSAELSANSTRSVSDMMIWVRHVVNKALKHGEVESVVDKVKKYISLHLEDDELTRDKIAAQTFLNPDYLSRLFKRETGLSISDYLLHERIRMAAELIAKTEMPISQVAGSVGYTNLSHFTTIFRKYMDYSPIEYRQRKQRCPDQ
ncbi:response regulator transcription factor [Paenibacillus lautus]|uniref:response regulator transcription factor n=1 Tax=Paenibacillus lautus TaxID=1401 RepID=UPI003D9A6FF3